MRNLLGITGKKMLSTINANRSLAANILGTFGIKGLSIFVSLISLPAYMKYFSDQRVLGVWFSMLSVFNWILTFDLGIGNGLRNHLVKPINDNDVLESRKMISSSYYLALFLSAFFLLVGIIAAYQCDWNKLLNIPSELVENRVLRIVVIVVFSGITIQFVLKLIVSILLAMQKTALANFVTLLANFLMLLYVAFTKMENVEKGLIRLAFVQSITINLPLLIVSVTLFSTHLKAAKPSLHFFKSDYAIKIMRLGYSFLWVQITLLTINASNDYLIARLYEPRYVVQYQAYNRAFTLFVVFFAIITAPIWSLVTKAKAQQNYNLIIRISKTLNVVALALSFSCLAIVPFLQRIMDFWLGQGAITITPLYSIIFAIVCCEMLFLNATTCISNGIGDLGPQILFNTLAAVLKIPLTLLAFRLGGEWICVVAVNLLVLFPGVLIQSAILRMRVRRNQNAINITSELCN